MLLEFGPNENLEKKLTWLLNSPYNIVFQDCFESYAVRAGPNFKLALNLQIAVFFNVVTEFFVIGQFRR